MKNKTIFCTVIIFVLTEVVFSQSSVMSSGNWFKLSVKDEGIYCISHSDLVALGINPSAIDPRTISMYGHRSGMLPVENNVAHPGDLKEIAILIKGEADGAF